jgi:hypothetical protein
MPDVFINGREQHLNPYSLIFNPFWRDFGLKMENSKFILFLKDFQFKFSIFYDAKKCFRTYLV